MVAGSDMTDPSLILDGHRVHLRGNFAIHHPGELIAKLKPFRVCHAGLVPVLFGSMVFINILIIVLSYYLKNPS